MAGAYVPPTPAEVRIILSALGLTGGQAAAISGLSDGRQVRKYTGGADPRSMSYPVLYTLLSRAAGRSITPDGWRDELSDLLRKSHPLG